MNDPTVLIVPGMRAASAQHWQTHLAGELPRVGSVAPMGREDIDLRQRVNAIEAEARAIDGPMIIVAHSAGTIMVAHWALQRTRRVVGAVLVTPPDFETPMPEGYPSISELAVAGWLPVPRVPLPFPSIVVASRNDPLGSFERVAALAADWGSQLADLGEVGHMNPQSGFGRWDGAHEYIQAFTDTGEAVARACWSQPLRF
jgi:predicted alpha/beta hydrolase family esterase